MKGKSNVAAVPPENGRPICAILQAAWLMAYAAELPHSPLYEPYEPYEPKNPTNHALRTPHCGPRTPHSQLVTRHSQLVTRNSSLVLDLSLRSF